VSPIIDKGETMKIQTKRIVITLLLLIGVSVLAATGLRERTVEWLDRTGLNPAMVIIILSMLPIVELRGAIPVAMFFYRMHWMEAATLSIIGNMLPIPVVLLLYNGLFRILRRSRIGIRFTDWLYRRTRRKGKVVEKYQALGLSIFVGIPLPVTGAWTGALAANIFDIKFWRAMFFIFLGVLMAAVIVTSLCLLGIVTFG